MVELLKMKILIVNRALGVLFGGGESFDQNAARYLQKMGHKVTIVTARSFFKKPGYITSDSHIVYLLCPNLRHFAYITEKFSTKISAAFYHLDNIIFEYRVFRWISKQRSKSFDIVQCCGLLWLSKQLLRKRQQPTISWLPGPPTRLTKCYLANLSKEDHFAIFTHGSTELILKTMGWKQGKEYEIIEPGVELDTIAKYKGVRHLQRQQLNIDDNVLLGITTARLVSIKNHSLLLEAIASAHRHGIQWKWLLIGEGPLEQTLRQQVKKLELIDHVYFLGYQPPECVYQHLAAADLFVLTSNYESFSISTLEAMAQGLPIIGTPVGYLQQIITKADAGLVLPSANVEDLTYALIKMANPDQRYTFGMKGKAFVQQFDWTKVAKKLVQLYQLVIEKRKNTEDAFLKP
ncbi:MAG: glycogen synthase [Gammaproteobacteria bacterium]|jgi:glycosyltransferase involved in cell wall biosynthesis|nr:glycogen synthase [Gammaproteobacteria bacterium]